MVGRTEVGALLFAMETMTDNPPLPNKQSLTELPHISPYPAHHVSQQQLGIKLDIARKVATLEATHSLAARAVGPICVPYHTE